MVIGKEVSYEQSKNRDTVEETTKHLTRTLEGEIQAQLNRSLRLRRKGG
jgi:hypothetical protein